ncbi:PhoH family protein [Arthrobacter sp. NPDC090010]|uniref:PhoH family protein n=1 Tax=Arthrobacter sp. NPDC090010 TaxID=3363942 RepID=UPI00382F15C1
MSEESLAAGPLSGRTDFPHSTPVARTEVLVFDSTEDMVRTLGAHDEALRSLEGSFPTVAFHVRGDELTLKGPAVEVQLAQRLVLELRSIASRGTVVGKDLVTQLLGMLRARTAPTPTEVLTQNILSSRGRTIRPKTLNQKSYVDAIDDNTVVFGLGPAGTGKTYLAMAKAVQALQNKEVSRIILTRPAVEAGERLGFLPGTLSDKIDPYLRPLFDALHDMMDPESIPRLMAAGTIEVAPLAYMRGRTLNDAFIILDEAQNTTPEQMKMFLTRLGFGSKMVVTGDTSQVDLPSGTSSGLRIVQGILEGIEDIHFAVLDATDVVRHRLVGDIVTAYNRWDEGQQNHTARRRPGQQDPSPSVQNPGAAS